MYGGERKSRTLTVKLTTSILALLYASINFKLSHYLNLVTINTHISTKKLLYAINFPTLKLTIIYI